MTAKHTPGPWAFEGDGLRGADGQLIFRHLGIDPRAPDSRLLAAAPALADALEELLAELDCIGDGPLRYDKCLRGLAGQPCPPCAKAIRAAAALRAARRLP